MGVRGSNSQKLLQKTKLTWEGVLRQTKVLIVLSFVCLIWNFGASLGQTGPSCAYQSGIPVTTCPVNPTPASIPAGLGGSLMNAGSCVSSQVAALAAIDSYDDPSCHSTAAQIPKLPLFVSDGLEYLPPDYQKSAYNNGLRVTLYCDSSVNRLIFAYRGSVSITAQAISPLITVAQFADWVETNIIQHLGTVPLQYQAASDVPYQANKQLRQGSMNKICGDGPPKFLLTGHSKGGGEAQYAAIKNKVEAIVFNSDPVNPIIFTSSYSADSPVILQWFQTARRALQSIASCFSKPGEAARSNPYYLSGHIRDIRMTNDFLAKYVLLNCNFPHAPIEWLTDTSTCEGHGIDTVVRELGVCASASP